MHVLLLPSWYPAPDRPVEGIFFREQAAALAAAGYRTGVVAPLLGGWRRWWSGRRLDLGQPPGAPVEEVRDWATAWWPGWEGGRRRAFLAAGRRLFDDYVAAHGMPDVLHAHSALYGGELAAELSARHGRPFVVTEHSTAFAAGRLAPWQLALAGQVFSQADAALAVSPAFRELLAARFPRQQGWGCVANVVDERFFAAPLSAAPEGGELRFLALGTLYPKKGFDLLLSAMARLPSGFHLRLAGDGAERDALAQQCRALGLADRVTFTGALDRDQVVAEMSQAHAFVLSSRVETFGVVVAEALAMGLPVVATRCGGPETVLWADAGQLVPAGDVAALADAMAAVADQARTVDRAALRAGARARFSGAAVAAALGEVYAAARDAHGRA